MKPILPLALLALSSTACTGLQADADGATRTPAAGATAEVVLVSDVEWGPLNPARGDKGPRAGTLWGDRTGPGPSGFLVEFLDGFESPPHIHNVSYRGAVLSGLVHNDDPEAGELWMPAGSFWTQPRGAVHVTAASGRRNLAYVEIEEGPYLVMPVEEEFPTDEAPLNVAASNLVWIDPPGRPAAAGGPKLAYLWGKVQEGELNGTLVRLPAGFTGSLQSHGSTLVAVVIQGRARHRPTADSAPQTLEPGSALRSSGAASHRISCDPDDEVLLYVRTEGPLDVAATRPSSGN